MGKGVATGEADRGRGGGQGEAKGEYNEGLRAAGQGRRSGGRRLRGAWEREGEKWAGK